MDRFIDRKTKKTLSIQKTLKSNMDRFIGDQCNRGKYLLIALKSNMDRFIVTTVLITVETSVL